MRKEASTETKRQVAIQLAQALDRDEYEAARALLAKDCVYDLQEDMLKGPDAILNSYRNSSERGRRVFDEVTYVSAAEQTVGDVTAILFTDHLRRGEWKHEHLARQLFAVNDEGLVYRIEHQAIEGERERLIEFMKGLRVSED